MNENSFAGWVSHTTWVFTTRDATAPEVTKAVADNIAKDAFDVVLQLDKPGKVYVYAVAKDAPAPTAGTVTGSGVSKEVAAASTDVTVSLDGFTEGASYDVYVVTENAEANDPTQSGATKEITVTTADMTAPTVAAMYPADGETEADVNKKDYLTLELSEDVKIGTGAVDVYTWDAETNHTLLVSVSVADCMVSMVDGTTENDSLYIPVDKSLWASEGVYFVKYNEGIVTDLAGNKLAAEVTTEGWKFTVADFLAPTYTIVPTDGTTNASETQPIVVITFNETVTDDGGTPLVAADFETGTIVTIKDEEGGVVDYTPSLVGNELSLTLDAAKVTSNAAFEVTIDTKKIYDAAGNAGTTSDKVNFSIKDFEAPTVDVKPDSPAPSENITVVFNEKVYKADGSEVTDADVAAIVIFRKGTSAAGAIVSATYSVAADGKSFIIDPANDLADAADYFVKVGAGSLEDAEGNAIAAYEEVITVADVVAPTAEFSIAGTTPVDPATAVMEFTFSEAMETLGDVAVSGDATALVNFKEDGENFPFTAAWDVTDVDAPKVVVTATLNAGKTYTIGIGKSLQDVAENPFAGISKTFQTWSDAAPAAVTYMPAKDATEQANDVAISVTFDQTIVETGAGTVTVVGTVSGDVAGATTVDGATLKIAHGALTANETVTVTISAGYLEGANGIATTAAVTWDFMTEDTTAPAVVTFSPANGSTGVAVDSKLVLTFSEKIVEKTGSIFIKDYATDVTVMTLTEADAEVKDNTKLEVTPTATFSYNKQYYVEVTSGLVEDVNANPNAAITGNATWEFTTAATAGAFTVKLDASSPANEEDKVDETITTLEVVFNRDIKAGSLSATNNVSLTGAADGLVFDDAANTGRFSISGNTLTIQTLGDLVADETYTLVIDAGIAKDAWGTDNDAATIVFYTKDVNAPEVASHTPAKDAEDVPVNTTITLNWDEAPLHAADGSAITAADIKADALVTVDGGTAYTAAINGTQWVLTMDANFTEKDVITVVVKNTAIEDALGNTGTTDYDWSFTVEDKTCNAPTAFAVTENTAGTKIKFTVDFDEKGTVYYMVQPSADTAPDAAAIMAADMKIAFATGGTSDAKEVTGLTSAMKYKAYFVAVDDADNTSTVYPAPEFTTADVIAPELLSMTPANEATGVAANTTLVLKFDEAVVVTGLGHAIVREVATDIIVADVTVDGGSTTLSDDDKTATIATGVTLGNETAYYVEVSAGSFTDVAGNAWAGISGVDNWSFTTKDTVAPELEKTYPDYDAADLPEITADETIWIEFNEAIKTPAGVVYVKYAATDDVFEVVNASAMTMSDDKMTLSFNLTNVPTEETEFYLDLVDFTVKDEADNAWVNALTGGVWDFIILDQTAPALASSVPANNATMVAIDQVITLTFTEGILSAEGKDFDGTDAKIEDVITLKDSENNTVDATVAIDAGRTVVTVTPDEDLNSESVYTVYVSPVTDDRENLSDEITVTFTTKDMTAPAVEMWDPEYDTTFNPNTGVVTVTFTEAVFDEAAITAEGNVVTIDILDENIVDFFTYNVITAVTRDTDDKITGYTEGADVEFTGTISADKKVITLTPAEDELPLISEGWYRVELIAGVIKDDAVNANEESETIFQVEDHVKPTVTAYSPVGAIEKDGDLTITFDENVAVGTGMIYIRNYVNGEVVATVDVTDADQVTIEDNVVTINPTDDLPEAMSFFITADAATFVDASANANEWEGIATDAIDTWNVSTDDAVAPGVIAENGLFPVPEATNVPTNTDITITFDKKVQLNDDGEPRWVVIYNEDWTPYQVIEVNAANIDLEPVTDPILEMDRIVSIKHMELEPSSVYYVRVMKGSVTDVAGNLFAGIMDDSWSFTTEDNSAPAIEVLTPADDSEAVDASADLVIEFDRNVLANAAGMIKVYKEMPGEELGVLVMTVDPTSEMVSIVDNIATINLPENLEFNTGYYVIVEAGSFTNTSTSKFPLDPGITTTQGWNFTTGDDMVAPVVVELSPDEETLEDNHPVFIMTFDENVQLTETGGSIHVTLAGEETAVLDIPLTADMIVDNVITIEYEYDAEVGGLDKNADYFVTVDADAIQDMTGNAFAGISDAAEWTFTTGADFATGVEDPVDGSLEFKVYPNPFDSYVTVKNADKLSRVIITNVAGQRVKDIANPTETIQTGDLRSGLYIITLVTKDDVVAKTERIVKR